MLGKVFALCDADEQAAFLNEAGRALSVVCVDDDKADMQLLRIGDRLDDNGRWFIRQLATFVRTEN
jgi:hypothetical protein